VNERNCVAPRKYDLQASPIEALGFCYLTTDAHGQVVRQPEDVHVELWVERIFNIDQKSMQFRIKGTLLTTCVPTRVEIC